MEKLLWNLFKKTGNINYYLLYRKTQKSGDKNEGNNRRDSSK